ncbi:MAG: aspartate kinase [Tissierellales bacterium]|nr:aspartate kinase [Tissierellales bacterium]
MTEFFVSKFGGSSLATSKQYKKVKEIVNKNENIKVVVPSAPGKRDEKDHKITDLLYMCHQLSSHGLKFDDIFKMIAERFFEIRDNLSIDVDLEKILDEIKTNIENNRSIDYCASRGEHLNGILLAKYLGFEFIDAAEVIFFNEMNEVDEKKTIEELQNKIKLGDKKRYVVPGFYGSFKSEIKTFSRGGSDITGSVIANAIDAKIYENWTDVSGFLVADPKIVENPKEIEHITYKELRELSYMGAKVLHEEAIFPVKNKGIPIHIKNTNRPYDKGTLIVPDTWNFSKENLITGIAGKKGFTVITVEKTLMNSDKSFLRKLVSVFETNDISIEHMPSGIDSISIIVSDIDLNGKLSKIIEEIRIYLNPDNIISSSNMALVAVVGRGMIRTKGISAKVFTALSDAGVNIRMISQGSSELNIIIGLENSDFETAIRAIYKSFYN